MHTSNKKKIYLASDHAGFPLKAFLKEVLTQEGHDIEDCGAFSLDEHDDYPDFIIPCARKVAEDEESFGIIIGGSGQGEAMVANRISGVRAVVFYGEPVNTQIDSSGANLSLIASVRDHNNANILSLGARFITKEDAKKAVYAFLTTSFSFDERHIRRIKKTEF